MPYKPAGVSWVLLFPISLCRNFDSRQPPVGVLQHLHQTSRVPRPATSPEPSAPFPTSTPKPLQPRLDGLPTPHIRARTACPSPHNPNGVSAPMSPPGRGPTVSLLRHPEILPRRHRAQREIQSLDAFARAPSPYRRSRATGNAGGALRLALSSTPMCFLPFQRLQRVEFHYNARRQ